jgi:hypothetical protein
MRAKALTEAGWIARFQGDYERAVALLEEGRALFEELEDRPGIATSLFHLGHMVTYPTKYKRLRAPFPRSSL